MILMDFFFNFQKVVVVRYVLTRGKSPKLGVLIPSVPDETTPSVFPQGFHLFPIPFSGAQNTF